MNSWIPVPSPGSPDFPGNAHTQRQTMFFEPSKFQVVLSSSNIVVLNLVAGIKTYQSIQQLTFQYQYHYIIVHVLLHPCLWHTWETQRQAKNGFDGVCWSVTFPLPVNEKISPLKLQRSCVTMVWSEARTLQHSLKLEVGFGGNPPIRWEGGVKSPHRNIPVFFKTCESCLWGLWLGFVNCGLICDIRIPSFDITTLLALTTPGWLNHALRPNQSLEVLFLELGTWCEWSGLYIPIWRLCIVIWVFPCMVVPLKHPKCRWVNPTILGVAPICTNSLMDWLQSAAWDKMML